VFVIDIGPVLMLGAVGFDGHRVLPPRRDGHANITRFRDFLEESSLTA